MTDMSAEELMQRWEAGEPVQLIPSILVLLKSIDASLKVLVERTAPITHITINDPDLSALGPREIQRIASLLASEAKG